MSACGGGAGSADDTSAAALDARTAAEQADVADTSEAGTMPNATDIEVDGDIETTTDLGDGATVIEATAASSDRTERAMAAPPVAPGTATPVSALAVAVNPAMIPARSLGAAHDQLQATGEMPPSTNIGAFRTSCGFSHMGKDDPIVYPNRPGASHLHTFFGNTGTNAYTTASTLAASGNSTCRGGTVNRSAYWVPTMIDTRHNAPIKPESAMIYYKTGYNGIKPSAVQPFPAGLRMIAGDPKNTKASGPFQYKCIGMGAERKVGANIQNCPAGAKLWAVVFFPQCWDGRNLDSPDHKSHMSYTVKRACPRTHPVPVPEITINVIYSVNETNAPLRWRLASDAYDRKLPAGYSGHGDWFNGWKQDVMKTWVQKCDQAAKDCHAHLLGDGRAMY